MKRKIYLATSWKNTYFNETLAALQRDHDVYNFQNPAPNDYGFQWSTVDFNWSTWNTELFVNNLKHPISNLGFKHDRDALNWCDTGVLLLPSGRSAHLEAGYLIGQGKQVYIYIPKYDTPELMYKLATGITGDLKELIKWLV